MARSNETDVNLNINVEGLDEVKDLEDKIEEISDTDIELEVDGKDAERKIDQVLDSVEDLSEAGRKLVIDGTVTTLESKLRGLQRDLARLEDPADIQVKAQEIDDAQRELRELAELANDRYEVDIQIDPQRQLPRAADDLGSMRANGEGLQSALPAMRGFTDELGESAQQAGVAGQALGDLGDLSLIMGEKFGISQGATAALGTALGAAGVATVILLPLINELTKETEASTVAAEDLYSIQEAIADQRFETAAEKIAESYAELIAEGKALGFSERQVLGALLNKGQALGTATEFTNKAGESTQEYVNKLAREATALASSGKDFETYANSVEAAGEILGVVAEETVEVGEANEELAGHLMEVNDDYLELGDKGLATLESLKAETKQLDRENQALGDTLAGLDARSSYLGLLDDIDSFREKMADGELSVREQEQALLELKGEVSDYLIEVQKIPAEQVTEIVANLDEAALAEFEAYLDDLERVRTIQFNLRYNWDGGLDPDAGPGPNISGFGVAQTSTGARMNGGGSRTSNLVVNVATSTSMRGVDRAIRRWRRVNG